MADIIFLSVLTGLSLAGFSFVLYMAYSFIKIEKESRRDS